ncbi:MAG: peptidase S1 [Deltaproteobacteria bacterium RIFOXYD12_FULL_55_16]|nr:MAG: peptidase S1 [Deltaproteobacteria bacterium RIFOXYD12_FULL_55_16]
MIHSLPTYPPRRPAFVFLALLFMGLCLAPLSGLSQAAGSPPETFADLAEKLSPTVVNIYTTQMVKSSRTPHELFNNRELPEPFRRFFGLPSPFDQEQPRQEQKRTSLGSGVIISKDGYIVTNNHVVENADTINVRLTNFEEYEAKIIGRDPKTDLALLKIAPKNGLPATAFGDSDKLRVGDWVMAIGNPFGFEQTVTAGIVSGKGRSLGSGPYENFIQTDASINPGNSGGPLFNLKGEMIGINSAIYSRNGGNIGIGFAIPANMAKNVINQLREHGSVVRGWLGVMIQPVTPELAAQFKMERPIGALVGEVTPDSPADKAGLKPGDIIIEFNGKEISQTSMLPNLVAETPVGSKAEITLHRKGALKKLPIVIAKLKEEPAPADESTENHNKPLGLGIQDLTPEIAAALGLTDKQGVLVNAVEPNSPAAEAGLRKGDLILEFNQKPVRDVKAFHNETKGLKAKATLSFFIRRKGRTQFLGLKLK